MVAPVSTRTSRPTTSGWRSARWRATNPPNDWPKTAGRPSPSVRHTAAASSAYCSSVQVSTGGRPERPCAPVVDVHQLGGVGQRPEERLEVGVVVAGATVQDEHHGALAHPRAVGDEARPLHVDVQLGPVHGHPHDALPAGGPAGARASVSRGRAARPPVPRRRPDRAELLVRGTRSRGCSTAAAAVVGSPSVLRAPDPEAAPTGDRARRTSCPAGSSGSRSSGRSRSSSAPSSSSPSPSGPANSGAGRIQRVRPSGRRGSEALVREAEATVPPYPGASRVAERVGKTVLGTAPARDVCWQVAGAAAGRRPHALSPGPRRSGRRRLGACAAPPPPGRCSAPSGGRSRLLIHDPAAGAIAGWSARPKRPTPSR